MKRGSLRDNRSIVNVEDCQDEKEVNILSKKDKLVIGGLIWFNNNKQIAKIIAELIYESEIKKKMKTMEKNKKGNTQQKKDALFDIVKHNIIFLTKYLYKKIPKVKNFVHYFDFLAKYSENMKLYTVIDKFVSGIREKLDSLNHVDILVTMLCEDTFNVEEMDIYQREIQKKKRRKSYKEALKKRNSLKQTSSHKVTEQQKGNSKGNNDYDDDNSCSTEGEDDGCINKNQVAQDLRKCLLYICESTYRNLHMDMLDMEENRNNKNEVSGIAANEKNAHSMKPVIDVEKMKKMIHYTFHVIKNGKQLITMHHIHQEQLLLVYKILKTALLECRHIYQNGDKNNIYNFSATLIEYFKNDLDTSLNYFFNNIFPYLKETYEYLFFVINTMKLPYYATKYTMNIISLFLCLNESLPNTHRLSEEPLFELYYTYYNNLLDGFFCYRKRNNTEVELNENEGNPQKYLLNYRNNIIVINKNMAHVKTAEINTIESNIYINIMMLIHIHTLCFANINAGLALHNEKNNIQVDKRGHKLVKKNYFVFSEKEEYKTFFKNCTSVIELLLDQIGGSIYGHAADRNHSRNRHDRNDKLCGDDVEGETGQQKNDDEDEDDEDEEEKDNDEEDEEEEEETEQTESEGNNEDDEDYNTEEEEEHKSRHKDGVMDRWGVFDNNEEFRKKRKKKKKKGKKKKKKKESGNVIRAKRTPSNKKNINGEKRINIFLDKRKHTKHNLYYCPDTWVHSNVVLYICFYLLKVKVNSIKYYGRDSPLAPTSRLCLLCVDLIYILYENYVYHLCRKRDLFNALYDYYLKSGFSAEEQLKAETNSSNKRTEKQGHQRKHKEKDNTSYNDINSKDFEELKGLNANKKNTLKFIFIELNYVYENVTTLRNDFNEIQIMLLRVSNNTILKYSVFLNLMSMAQLDNALAFPMVDLERYRTVEAFLNFCDTKESEEHQRNIRSQEEEGQRKDQEHLNEKDENIELDKYLNRNEELNKYKNVSRYVFRDDNTLFNFVTDLFKHVEKINNENINFVTSFLSLDISVFFPLNSYTYITDMCKIYNKDQLSTDAKILEMQYIHMTLVIGYFILNTNNINIYNSCLGVLLLIHLNVKNKGLASIALNFHNKLKKYDIDIFYEVLLCGLVGLYTAFANHAMDEKDLLLFSSSIANRLGVKILERQKLPLCKFIHASVNCALNLKNHNTFLKYIFPFAQKLNLNEHQFNYLKKQILLLLEAYNSMNPTKLAYPNSIFEHLMQVVNNEKKLRDEFKEGTYEDAYMTINEDVCMNICKNIASATHPSSTTIRVKTEVTPEAQKKDDRRKGIEYQKEIQTDKERGRHEEEEEEIEEEEEVQVLSEVESIPKRTKRHNKLYSSSEKDRLLSEANENTSFLNRVKKERVYENSTDSSFEKDFSSLTNESKANLSQDEESEIYAENTENLAKVNKKECGKGRAINVSKKPVNKIIYSTHNQNNSDSSSKIYKETKNNNRAAVELEEGSETVGSFFKMTNEIPSSPKPVRNRKQTNLHLISNKKLDICDASEYSSDLFDPSPEFNQDDLVIDESSLNPSLNPKQRGRVSESLSMLGSLSSLQNKTGGNTSISFNQTPKSGNFSEFGREDNLDSQDDSLLKSNKKKNEKPKRKYSSISYADDLLDF